MDPVTARYEVLKLAKEFHMEVFSEKISDEILSTAKSWGDWVLGDAPRPSKRQGLPKGADDPP